MEGQRNILWVSKNV